MGAAAPTVTYAAPAPTVTHGAPAPAVTYAAPTPVTYAAPSPVVTYAAPEPYAAPVSLAYADTFTGDSVLVGGAVQAGVPATTYGSKEKPWGTMGAPVQWRDPALLPK